MRLIDGRPPSAIVRALALLLVPALAPPAEGAPGQAVVSVGSEPPGAQVRCDGVLRGATPLGLELPPGEHRIVVSLAGYLENSRMVTLAAGELRSLHVVLTAAGEAPVAGADQKPRRKRILVAAGAVALAVGGGLTYALTRNGAPEATATVSPASGMAGATSFRFTATARDDDDGAGLLGYAWEFGDGTTAAEPSPTHVYESPGSFTVRLTVRDRKGKASAPATVSVTVLRGLAGRWTGRVPGVGNLTSILLTQSDTALSGTLSWGPPVDERATVWCAGTCAGTLSGQASTTYPADLTFTANVLGMVCRFTGSSADGSALVGTSSWEWPGSVSGGGATTFTRQ